MAYFVWGKIVVGLVPETEQGTVGLIGSERQRADEEAFFPVGQVRERHFQRRAFLRKLHFHASGILGNYRIPDVFEVRHQLPQESGDLRISRGGEGKQSSEPCAEILTSPGRFQRFRIRVAFDHCGDGLQNQHATQPLLEHEDRRGWRLLLHDWQGHQMPVDTKLCFRIAAWPQQIHLRTLPCIDSFSITVEGFFKNAQFSKPFWQFEREGIAV